LDYPFSVVFPRETSVNFRHCGKAYLLAHFGVGEKTSDAVKRGFHVAQGK